MHISTKTPNNGNNLCASVTLWFKLAPQHPHSSPHPLKFSFVSFVVQKRTPSS